MEQSTKFFGGVGTGVGARPVLGRASPAAGATGGACTASSDGAEHWSGPRAAASRASDLSRPGLDELQYGEYAGLAVAHGLAHALWTDSRCRRTFGKEIYATVLRERDLR